MEPRQPEGESMTTPEAIKQATERMFEFCNANDITDIIDVNHGGTGTSTFSAGGVVYSDGVRLTQDNDFVWDSASNT